LSASIARHDAASRVAPLGWHVQIYGDGDILRVRIVGEPSPGVSSSARLSVPYALGCTKTTRCKPSRSATLW